MQAHAVASLPVGRVRHFNQAWLAWIALSLSVIGGYVDAVCYLALFRLFTAHMTGNTATAGADLAQLEWSPAVHSIIPVVAFLAGVCLGAIVKQEGIRRGMPSWFAISCCLECLLLGALLVFGRGVAVELLDQNSATFFVLVSLPCLAMGIQSVSFQRVGSVGVRTTFVTGILTGLGEELVLTLYGLRQPREDADRREVSVASSGTIERAMLFGGLWFAYLIGGLLAGLGLLVWQLASLAVPMLGLVALAMIDVLRPMQPTIVRH